MNHQDIYISLDIGSSSIKVLIGEMSDSQLHVIGVGQVKSNGIRRGAIVDIDATVQSIKKAVEQAERMTGLKIEEVVLGVPANQTVLQPVKGVVAVNGDGREISDDDLARVLDSAESIATPPEKEIVNLLPRRYTVDLLSEIKDPRGMIGTRLEVDATLIMTSKTLLHNVLRCVERAGLSVREIYLQPLAAGYYALTEDERNQGTAYIDLGGGSTTVAVFEDGLLTHTGIVGMGGDQITKDLSIVLETSTEQAEKIKKQYGHAFLDDASDDQLFEVQIDGTSATQQFSQRYIAEIIGARVEEIFEYVLDELSRLGVRDLPGGIVLTGGVAGLEGIGQVARQVMQLRVRIHTPDYIGVRDPGFTTTVGLIRYAHSDDEFYGRSSEMQTVSGSIQPTPPKNKSNATEKKVDHGNKTTIMDKAKKFFNNFFE
ncbi:cell division protein FtsA [Lysinibacillus sp. 3P01SB]|uniref:cell division protein FtsA n=1 Tax=Lysinibacillus sp. 3P01SB TaxID=3132284 RepID=UPI0039A56703